MRLIDADAFIEFLKETSKKLEFDKIEFKDSSLTAQAIIDGVIADLDGTSLDGFENAPTIEPEQKWIPVNDVIGVGYNEHEIGPSKWRAVCYNCGAHDPYCKTNTEAMEAWNHRFADDICVGSKERTAKVDTTPDLRNTDLHYANLHNADLHNADLQ